MSEGQWPPELDLSLIPTPELSGYLDMCGQEVGQCSDAESVEALKSLQRQLEAELRKRYSRLRPGL